MSNSESKSKSKAESKALVFFVENEFCFYDHKEHYKKRHTFLSTINVVQISVVTDEKGLEETKTEVFKMNFRKIPKKPKTKLCLHENAEYFFKVKGLVNKHFVDNNPNAVFIGCVRDDSYTHQFEENREEIDQRVITEMEHRTDIYHDISNIFCNFMKGEPLINSETGETDGEIISFESLLQFQNQYQNIVGELSNAEMNNDALNTRIRTVRKIKSISDDIYLEEKCRYMRELFDNDYFAELQWISEEVTRDKNLTQFGDEAKKALKIAIFFQNLAKSFKLSDDPYDERRFNEILTYLQAFEKQTKISGIKNLCHLLRENQNIFKAYNIRFTVGDLSTKFIEGEKAHLREKNKLEGVTRPPTLQQCDEWIEKAVDGLVEPNAESGSGRVNLKFSQQTKEFREECKSLNSESDSVCKFKLCNHWRVC